MPEEQAHLTATTLEQLAEGTASGAEATEARAHLDVCQRCAGELEFYQNLFTALSELPRFAPAPDFADAVMARVELSAQENAVIAWMRRLAPARKRGWVMLGALVTAPAMPFIALFAWLVIQPLVSPTLVWQWIQLRIQSATQTSAAWVLDFALGSGVPEWLGGWLAMLQGVPVEALGGVLVILAMAIPVSTWYLYRLIRTPGVGISYAN